MSQIPRHQTHPLLVARVAGSEPEMGRQLGEMIRTHGQFQEALDYYPRMVEIVLAGNSKWGRRAVRPLAEWGMRKLDRRRIPELRERTPAFLKGLGVSPEWSRYYQLFDSMQNLVSMAGRLGALPFQRAALSQAPAMCSSLVAWGRATADGQLRHLRNFDLPGVGVFERTPMVVFCSPQKGLRYGYASVRAADLCSINGFNEAGLSVTTHNRFHRQTTWNGTPISDLVHQLITRATTLDEAMDVVHSMEPIASSWGIAISSAKDGKALHLETHSGFVRATHPPSDEHYVAVTNHYVHPDMRDGELDVTPGRVLNTVGRYDYLRSRAADGGLELTELQ